MVGEIVRNFTIVSMGTLAQSRLGAPHPEGHTGKEWAF